MSETRQSILPAGRLNRMFRLGRMAAGMAGTALSQGARQIAQGEKPSRVEMLLNPANADRLAGELAQMRGAVMKVGQLLSMEAGDLLPPELTGILSTLRDSAHSMPPSQLLPVLTAAWGENWRQRFQSFDEQPFAAASIGQVHHAVDCDGRRLAIKVQYPGVADSIDSDINNVAALLKLFRLLPAGIEIDPLLDLARQQLHNETDYALEASHLRRYRERLVDDDLFQVPEVDERLSGPRILAMSFVDGQSIETLAAAPPQTRNRLAARLIDLCLHECLRWGMVQSDPNFANFLYDAERETIGLLDFGAMRVNQPGRERSLARLLRAAMDDDLAELVDAACEVGYLAPADSFNHRMAIADLIRCAAEPALFEGNYLFAESGLVPLLNDKLLYLHSSAEPQRIPPADVLFLHRKLAGIFLLCARIRAQVDVRSILLAHLECIGNEASHAPA